MLIIQEPEKRTTPATAWSLWNLGFRPFYLLAGTFAAIAMIIWVARYAGWTGELAYLRDPLWHAHEMIFGFAQAVIVGFLFTAVGNWTNQPTPTGRHLALIAVTWIVARVLVGLSWTVAAAVADTLFTALAAAGIHKPIHAANNRRNMFFVVLLGLIGLANIGFNLVMAGVLDIPARVMLQTGMNVVLLIMIIMGGRVIPMFTANAVQAQPVRKAWLERLSVGSVIALIVVDALNMAPPIVAVVAIVAGIAHAARLWLWQPWRTIGKPILWILHAAYAWIPLHLLLRAAAAAGLVTSSIATHALTVGAIGGLTLGMMTRTARGHTGRILQASRTETLCYALLQIGAMVRVFVPVAAPGLTLSAVVLSGALWSIAFGLFAIHFWPVLTQPRLDGRPG